MLLVLTLAGCHAMQSMNEGDRAMLAGRPQEALLSYQRAALYDSRLHADPDYRIKVREATWQAAFADGQSQTLARNWEQAIAAYEIALANNPGFLPAADGLARAKVGGAQIRYDQSIADADRGDLRSAEANLNQALRWDPGHAGAKAAMDSIARRDVPSASEQRYAGALRSVEAKQWDVVATETAAIIAMDRNHLPARALLHRSRGELAASRKVHEQASAQFSNQRFDDAAALAKQSLDIWSTNPDATDLLKRAQAKRDESEQHFTKAKALSERGEFDAALKAMSDCLEVYPYHSSGATYMRQIRLDAAATYNAEGRRLIAADKLDDAADAFRLALRYVSDDAAAKDGLIEVTYAYGQGAEKLGLAGNALLFYMDAVAKRPRTQKYVEAEKRVRAAIGEQVAFSVSLDVSDPQGQDTSDTKALQSRATALAAKEKPAYVTLVTPQANDNAQLKGPLYRAQVTMQAIQIQQAQIRKDRKEHLFTAYRPVPNPDIPQLEGQLQNAERDLAIARRNLVRSSCGSCGGRGHVVCNYCRGSRIEQCHHCGGRGRVNIHGRISFCNYCGGRGREACHHCSNGYFRCDRCGGRGFFMEVDSVAVNRAERQVYDLRSRLSREPVSVQQEYTVRWPYEEETHQKTGEFSASVRIDEAKSNTAIQSFDVLPRFSQMDSVVLNPAPEYGLPADDLRLPPDDTVYRVLVEDGATQLARGALQAATVARANGFIAKGNEEAKAKRTHQDIEARVAAMVLLESVKPSEAKRILNEIRNPSSP